MSREMKQETWSLALFLSFCLFLQLGAASYWKIADQAYMFFGLAAMGMISILVVRRKWRSVLDGSSRRE